MRSIGIKNQRLGLVLAAALGTIAMLALPGLAAAKARDRNHDHIPDRWEKRHHLSLRVNQARRNQDHEGLNNRQEFLAETNPRDPDSNNNGVLDSEENAGKIKSFNPATGELVIALFGGGEVSGMVTEETEIECHNVGSAQASDTQGDVESSEDENDQQESGEEGSDQQESSGEDDSEGQESSEDDSEEQESEDGSGDQGGGGNCTTAALEEPEAIVREAELKISNGAATFEKVELAG